MKQTYSFPIYIQNKKHLFSHACGYPADIPAGSILRMNNREVGVCCITGKEFSWSFLTQPMMFIYVDYKPSELLSLVLDITEFPKETK